MNALDLPTRNGKTVGEIALQPILDHKNDLTVVDVGARGGMHELPESYAKHANWIGFEPNPLEHEKIIAHKTDAEKAGIIPPKWKSETVKQVALWSESEVRKLYITKNVAQSSLMGNIKPEMADRIFLDYGGKRGGLGVGVASLGSTAMQVTSTEDVNCDRLDNILDDKVTVDYLKVDVEGAEKEVFDGGNNVLSSGRVLFVRTEFFCVPFYDPHPLFGHQHVVLHNHGFRLLNIDLGPSRYTRCRSTIPKLVDKGLPFVGNALYTLDPDRNKLSNYNLQRIGLVALTFGLRSFALSVFRDADLLSASQLESIEKSLSHVPLRRKLRRHWENFPAMFAEFIYTGKIAYRGHHWRYEA